MNITYCIPLLAIIIFSLSVIANRALIVHLCLKRKEYKDTQILNSLLHGQISEYKDVARRLSELVSSENARCMRTLDRVLTEREQVVIEKDVENYEE